MKTQEKLTQTINEWFEDIANDFRQKHPEYDLVITGSRAIGMDHEKSDIDMAVLIADDNYRGDPAIQAKNEYIAYLQKRYPKQVNEIKTFKTKAGLHLVILTVPCPPHKMANVKLDCTIRSRKLNREIQEYMEQRANELFPDEAARTKYREAVLEAYNNDPDEYIKLKQWQKECPAIKNN